MEEISQSHRRNTVSFSVIEFMNELIVNEDDVELKQAIDHAEITGILCDDAWLNRQAHFGLAGAMERQIEYLGGTLLPNTESRLQKLNGQGITKEAYVIDNWFGTTNADSEHIDTENKGDEILNVETFRKQLIKRMRTAGIILGVNIRKHDDISRDLEQLSYAEIKSKASLNRQAYQNKSQQVKAA
tara:strand:+ start:381 stop:938 length:558 start_codon:yes stop_codon:yes gene_type:complete